MASGLVRVVLAQPEHWTIGILSSNSGLSKSNNELRGVNRFRTQNFTSQNREHGGWYQSPLDAWTGSPPASIAASIWSRQMEANSPAIEDYEAYGFFAERRRCHRTPGLFPSPAGTRAVENG